MAHAKFITAQMQRFTAATLKNKQSQDNVAYKYFQTRQHTRPADIFVRPQTVKPQDGATVPTNPVQALLAKIINK